MKLFSIAIFCLFCVQFSFGQNTGCLKFSLLDNGDHPDQDELHLFVGDVNDTCICRNGYYSLYTATKVVLSDTMYRFILSYVEKNRQKPLLATSDCMKQLYISAEQGTTWKEYGVFQREESELYLTKLKDEVLVNNALLNDKGTGVIVAWLENEIKYFSTPVHYLSTFEGDPCK